MIKMEIRCGSFATELFVPSEEFYQAARAAARMSGGSLGESAWDQIEAAMRSGAPHITIHTDVGGDAPEAGQEPKSEQNAPNEYGAVFREYGELSEQNRLGTISGAGKVRLRELRCILDVATLAEVRLAEVRLALRELRCILDVATALPSEPDDAPSAPPPV